MAKADAIATDFTTSGYYRPLRLGGYRPQTTGDSIGTGAIERIAERREARTARNLAEQALRRMLRSSFAGSALTMALCTFIGFHLMSYMAAQYEPVAEFVAVVEEKVTESVDAFVETTGGITGDLFAPSAVPEGLPDEWVEPDIASDSPIIWEQVSDGSFVNNNGATIPAGARFGVDVSEHDGEIDWEAAKAGGVDFAIIRCGYGSDDAAFDDALWERNVSECERLGIPYGVYLYSYAPTPDWAFSEAEHVARLVEGHECPMGIWYDVEEPAQAEAYGYDAGLFGELVHNFEAAAEKATGIQVGVYTSRSWLDTHMSETAADEGIPVWCAYWMDEAPEGCDYACWQAGAAAMPGFEGAVDFDVIFPEAA